MRYTEGGFTGSPQTWDGPALQTVGNFFCESVGIARHVARCGGF